MLTISAPIFDIDGSAVIANPNQSGLVEFNKRVSRIATLDGGAAFNDFGYSDADRTLSIDFLPANEEQLNTVKALSQKYSRLIVSFSDGCFLGAPESFRFDSGRVTLVILVERKISA
jgi:hypothetical protein